jgi:hypothetical protein
MKRCPTCNKTFTDQNLIYCVDDGTPLVSLNDDEFTEIGRTSNPPVYQPPSYVPPGGNVTKPRVWPWVAGVIGLLVIALVGFVIAAVVYIPRLQKRANPVIVSKNNSNNENSSGNNNSNSSNQNSVEKNANENSTPSTPPPTDKELVLVQLKDLEQEWTVANINADKKALAKVLADDYVGPSGDGKIQGKAEYIGTIQRDTSVQKWEFTDLRLTLHGDRATLLGKVRFYLQDREVAYDFVDRFVWRDSRWQATGSEVTLNQ